MAHISAMIFPKSLGFRTRIEVIMPQDPHKNDPQRLAMPDYKPPGPQKVLYLLHGLSDDASAWGRNTRIGSYAEERNYIVIMPEVQRSFYSDMRYGSKYFTYISEELPQICEELFNFKHQRERTFVAGLSMGGYGAVKCGLTKPDFYAACAGFSGALDVEITREIENQNRLPELRAIIDVDLPVPDEINLFKLADKMSALPKEEQIRVLITCGDGDFLIDSNRKFDAHMKTLPVDDYKYEEWQGVHDWKFWEESLPKAFQFFESRLQQ